MFKSGLRQKSDEVQTSSFCRNLPKLPLCHEEKVSQKSVEPILFCLSRNLEKQRIPRRKGYFQFGKPSHTDSVLEVAFYHVMGARSVQRANKLAYAITIR